MIGFMDQSSQPMVGPALAGWATTGTWARSEPLRAPRTAERRRAYALIVLGLVAVVSVAWIAMSNGLIVTISSG